MRRMLSVLALTISGVSIASVAEGAGRSNLTLSRAGDPPSALPAGQAFSTVTTVRNVSRVSTSSTSTLRYYLSRDRFIGGSDIALRSHKIRRLRSGDSTTLSDRLVVPAETQAGEYRLVTCADATKRIRESDEGDNCLAGDFTLAVLTPL